MTSIRYYGSLPQLVISSSEWSNLLRRHLSGYSPGAAPLATVFGPENNFTLDFVAGNFNTDQQALLTQVMAQEEGARPYTLRHLKSVSDDASVDLGSSQGLIASARELAVVQQAMRQLLNSGVDVRELLDGRAPAHAGPRRHRFDPVRCAYNWKPSNTRRLRAALGLASYVGASRADMVVLGDSISEGQVGTATWNHSGAWSQIMHECLVAGGSALGPGAGGVLPGGYNVFFGSAHTNGFDNRVSKTGVWSNNSSGYISSIADAATLTFPAVYSGVRAVKGEGTAIDVAYERLSGGGTFTVSVDGGAPVQVNTAGAQGYLHYTVTGLTDGPHTVVITKTGTAVVRISGISIYRAYGLMVHNLARSGATAEEYAAFTAGGIHHRRFNSLTPGSVVGTVFLSLGANDLYLNNRTAAQVKGYLQTIKELWAQQDIILLNYPEVSAPSSEGPALHRVLYDLADEWDVPLIDNAARWGTFAEANAALVMSGDGTHPNSRYQGALGMQMASLLTS